jgi:transposase
MTKDRKIRALSAENARLRTRLEAAERAGKRQAAPFSKGEPKASPKAPGRKKGRRYGRRGSRSRPRHCDEVINVPHGHVACPDCSGPLADEVHSQYVTDIPPVKPKTTRFDVHVGYCACCGKRVQGRDPRQVSDALGAAANQIGGNALALAAHLNKSMGASYERIAYFFLIAFDLSLARSTLARGLERLAVKAEPLYQRIQLLVRKSPVVYPDETGWRIGGQKAWLWDFVSLLNQATIYEIRQSRGFDVPRDILGEDYAGTLGRDGWASYDGLRDARHQPCLGHIFNRCDKVLDTVT